MLVSSIEGFAPQFRSKVASEFEIKGVGDWGLVYGYCTLFS